MKESILIKMEVDDGGFNQGLKFRDDEVGSEFNRGFNENQNDDDFDLDSDRDAERNIRSDDIEDTLVENFPKKRKTDKSE